MAISKKVKVGSRKAISEKVFDGGDGLFPEQKCYCGGVVWRRFCPMPAAGRPARAAHQQPEHNHRHPGSIPKTTLIFGRVGLPPLIEFALINFLSSPGLPQKKKEIEFALIFFHDFQVAKEKAFDFFHGFKWKNALKHTEHAEAFGIVPGDTGPEIDRDGDRNSNN
jgi:hypothetical protein